MTCEVCANGLVICRPSWWGLAEARDLWCLHCRAVKRHWAFVTNDLWYDPEPFWRCDTCGDTVRPGQQRKKERVPMVSWPPLSRPVIDESKL